MIAVSKLRKSVEDSYYFSSKCNSLVRPSLLVPPNGFNQDTVPKVSTKRSVVTCKAKSKVT